jgi:hypothetical protein
VEFGVRDMRTLLLSMFEFHKNRLKEGCTFVISVNEVYICACSVKPFIALKVKHTACRAALFTA